MSLFDGRGIITTVAELDSLNVKFCYVIEAKVILELQADCTKILKTVEVLKTVPD